MIRKIEVKRRFALACDDFGIMECYDASCYEYGNEPMLVRANTKVYQLTDMGTRQVKQGVEIFVYFPDVQVAMWCLADFFTEKVVDKD